MNAPARILPDLTNASPLANLSRDQLLAMLIALNTKRTRAITCKVTVPKLDPKTGEMKGTTGALSVYGLGQFPITLYVSQWERLFAEIDNLKIFIADNASTLVRK